MQTIDVTPELSSWVAEQANSGLSTHVVQIALTDAGWSELQARQIVEDTWPGSKHQVRLPGPSLAGSTHTLDAGDRLVQVLMNMRNPEVVVFGDLLSDAECDALIEQAEPRLKRSRTVASAGQGEEVNDSRTSNGMFFGRGESELVQAIEARIAKLLNWPVSRGEGLQILQYGPGAEYKPHYDYFEPDKPGTPQILARGGQRIGTLVIYLNNPIRGGGTTFPDLGLEVQPIKGNAVFFSYDKPHPSTKTLHGGAPVVEGNKWVATKWLREGDFA